MKQQKLESLKNVIACPVTLENFTDPVLLSSGHTIDRVALTGMVASGRTLKCPMTQKPIAANSTIPDKTLSSFMKLWPELESKVENMIRQAPKAKN